MHTNLMIVLPELLHTYVPFLLYFIHFELIFLIILLTNHYMTLNKINKMTDTFSGCRYLETICFSFFDLFVLLCSCNELRNVHFHAFFLITCGHKEVFIWPLGGCYIMPFFAISVINNNVYIHVFWWAVRVDGTIFNFRM